VINAETVLARRTERGLSQRQLAKHAGVSYMTISRMENGADTSNLPLSVLGRLADALNLEPSALLRSGTSCQRTPECPAETRLDAAALHHNAARLLRKLHRGDDIRKTMSQVDRELTLPALVKARLVIVEPFGLRLAQSVANSLACPT